ncbi:HEAT repeat domain-containing protein, partial [bacterium]|nr:HEAT repeat domain-containing protein [bacterium]
MNLESELILASVALLFWIDIVIVLQTLANKAKLGLSEEQRNRDLAEFTHLFESDATFNRKRLQRLFDNYLLLKQSIDLPEEEHQKVLKVARSNKLEVTLGRKIRYQSRYDRMEAALGLALIGSDHARTTLERALVAERDFPVKLFIANALSEIGDKRSVGVLVESLIGAHRWYRDKVNLLIASFGPATFEFLRGFYWREDSEIVEMFIDIAGEHINEGLEQYLHATLSDGQRRLADLAESIRGCPERCCIYCVHGRTRAEGRNRLCKYEGSVAPDFRCGRYRLLVTSKNPVENHHRLMVKAAECMEKYYSDDLDAPEFLNHSDPTIRAIAIRSLGNGNAERHIAKLLGYLESDLTRLPAKMGLSKILAAHPRLIPPVAEAFDAASDKQIQQSLAEVLAGRIEYFITKLQGKERRSAKTLIREVIALGKFSEIIEFLKLNRDLELEDAVVAIIAQEAADNESLREECGLYLPDRVLEKCGLEKIVPAPKRREEKRDWKMIRALYLILGFAILFFPMLYVARYHSMIAEIPLLVQLKTFVVDFNYDFAWYSMSVNLVYIVLLLLSVVKVKSSTRLWNLKTASLL